MAKPRIDLVGQRYGKLIVLDKTISQRYGKHNTLKRKVLCRCDCGTEKFITITHLTRRDGGATKSCGCYKLNKLPVGESRRKYTYNRYKRIAKQKDREFNLSYDEFIKLTQNNCYYWNCKPSNVATSKDCNGDFIYNGIDRVDSNKGYTMDNCVTCCKVCNFMKKDMSKEEFYKRISLIYERHIRC